MRGSAVRLEKERMVDPISLMLADLAQLERRERDVSMLRRKLHDRLDRFPNEVTQTREREVSTERRELHRRIDQLRALLTALNDRPPFVGPAVM